MHCVVWEAISSDKFSCFRWSVLLAVGHLTCMIKNDRNVPGQRVASTIEDKLQLHHALQKFKQLQYLIELLYSSKFQKWTKLSVHPAFSERLGAGNLFWFEVVGMNVRLFLKYAANYGMTGSLREQKELQPIPFLHIFSSPAFAGLSWAAFIAPCPAELRWTFCTSHLLHFVIRAVAAVQRESKLLHCFQTHASEKENKSCKSHTIQWNSVGKQSSLTPLNKDLSTASCEQHTQWSQQHYLTSLTFT